MRVSYDNLHGDGLHRLFGRLHDRALHVLPDGRGYPDRLVCWYSGMRLRRPSKGATGIDQQWTSTVEHIVPQSWMAIGLIRLTRGQRATNLVPVAGCLNSLVGNLPVFIKAEFRTILLDHLAGRREPGPEDKEMARRAMADLRARHGITHETLGMFSSRAWIDNRPDLFERERAFLKQAGAVLAPTQ